MDLTVGIVNYRSGGFLKACIECIDTHTNGIDYEIFVVDNHSQDGSVSFLDRHKKISHLILNRKNLGYASACNQIIANSNGRYVLLLNPDVQFSSNVLGEMVHFMDEHPSAMVAGCKILFPDGSLQGSCGYFPDRMVILLRSVALDKLCKRLPPFKRKHTFEYCTRATDVTEVDWVLGAFFLIRKAVCDVIGCFDDTYFLYGEEMDFCARLRRAQYSVLYNPHHEVIHHMGTSTRQRALTSIYHFHRAMYLLHKKFWMSAMSPSENLVVLNGIVWKMILAYIRHMAGLRKSNELYAHRLT